MAKASYHIALHTSQREKERGEGEGEGREKRRNFCNVKFLHSFYSQVTANNICSTLFKNHV